MSEESETVVTRVERDEKPHGMFGEGDPFENLMNRGYLIAVGLVMAGFGVGYFSALSSVVESTSFDWTALLGKLAAAHSGHPAVTVALIASSGALLLGLGVGWQLRREREGDDD